MSDDLPDGYVLAVPRELPWDLEGWGEVAGYLRCSVRCAQSYEAAGLPVIRFRGRIKAIRSQVLAWVREHIRATTKEAI